MDSITQLALGAAVGYVVGGKTLGKKAFLLGAFAGTLPDLDFIVTAFGADDFNYLNHHRGFSHSIIGALTLPFISATIIRLFSKKWPFKTITSLFFWAIATHILLDCFTSWGTQVFWPDQTRIAFNSIFIVDPLYTLPLLITLFISMFKKDPPTLKKLSLIGIILSSLYLIWALSIKAYITPQFETVFKENAIQTQGLTSRPKAFSTLSWSTTAETNTAYYVTQLSLLSPSKRYPLIRIPKNHALPPHFNDPITQKMLAFTKGYYTLEPTATGIWIHDLRYGLANSASEETPTYIFSYHLTKSDTNKTLVQTRSPRG